MKKAIKKCIAIIGMAIVVASCGGNGSNHKFDFMDGYKESQKWHRIDNNGTPLLSIISYNQNVIDNAPIVMDIHYSPFHNPYTGEEVWGISFSLVNIQKGQIGGTPTFAKDQKYITLQNEKGDVLTIRVISNGDNNLIVESSSFQQLPKEVEETLYFLAGNNDVGITAYLSNGKKYTWKFHSYLDLSNNK